MSKGWIGFDLDGTLAYYDPENDNGEIGKPIASMVKRAKKYIAAGEDVRIFTARAEDPEEVVKIRAWCKKHLGKVLPVTNRKDYALRKFYDDRAIHVEYNTGIILG